MADSHTTARLFVCNTVLMKSNGEFWKRRFYILPEPAKNTGDTNSSEFWAQLALAMAWDPWLLMRAPLSHDNH